MEIRYSADDQGRARFVLDQLAGERKLDSRLVKEAEDQLATLGAVGLIAARGALESNHTPTLVCAARVLLRAGGPDDRQRVARRIEEDIPARAATVMLAALVATDPILATPEYLIGLIDHASGTVRAAAQREVQTRLGPEHFGALTELLRSKRRNARLRGVTLLGGLRGLGDSVERVLVDRLADRASTVAWEAARVLAEVRSETIEERLIERAFRGGEVDRGGAYALLSIVEREDRERRPILGEAHVDRLLDELRDSRPVVVGAAATALAGIGFQSERAESLEWLELTVPHELVRISTGAEFHADFGSLQGPAQRRLQLLSGRAFGTDGSAWAQWWSAEAGQFRPRRAVLTLQPKEELALQLVLRDAAGAAQLLLGPSVEVAPPVSASSRTVVMLSESQVAALVQFLRTEGVFDARLLPHSASVANARVLDIAFGSKGKRFELEPSMEADWFDRIAARVHAFVETNSWQHFYPRSQYADARAFWSAERDFWQNNADEQLGAARRRDYILSFLAEGGTEEREAAVEALAELAQGPRGRLSAAELPRLIDITFAEEFFGARAETLLGLVLGAATGEDGFVAPEIADDLVQRSFSAWNDDALRPIVSILGQADLEVALALSSSEVVRERRCAVLALAERGSEAADERLLTLLADPEPVVEEAVVHALGVRRLEAARDELLLRARLGKPAVRAAALRAIGRLKGEGVRDALIVALVDTKTEISMAAVEALSDLEDPGSASLLARVFARGPIDPSFHAARRGLLRLGEHAIGDVSRLAASSDPVTRREAALLSSEQLMPTAAPVLIAWLTDHPDDARVGNELATLTCVDYRAEPNSADRWWAWWDQVVRDDALVWYLGALEIAGKEPPTAAAIAAPGTREGALYLAERVQDRERHMALRAERQLGRLLGRALKLSRGEERVREVEALRWEIDARFAE